MIWWVWWLVWLALTEALSELNWSNWLPFWVRLSGIEWVAKANDWWWLLCVFFNSCRKISFWNFNSQHQIHIITSIKASIYFNLNVWWQRSKLVLPVSKEYRANQLWVLVVKSEKEHTYQEREDWSNYKQICNRRRLSRIAQGQLFLFLRRYIKERNQSHLSDRTWEA